MQLDQLHPNEPSCGREGLFDRPQNNPVLRSAGRSSPLSIFGWLGFWWDLLWESFQNWGIHRGPRMGAALAFYAAVSLPPLAILTLSFLSTAMRKDLARKQILLTFHFLFGKRGEPLLDSVLSHPGLIQSSLIQTLISFVILLFAATQVFGELQNALDQIWEVSGKKRPFRAFLRRRLLSIAIIVAGAMLFFIFFYFYNLTQQSSQFALRLGIPLELIHWTMILVLATGLFAALFCILPRVQLRFGDVWPGALLTAFLFVVGRVLLRIYLQRTPLSLTYGALSSFLVVLLSVFYLAQIFYFGAEVTHCYAKKVGSLRRE